MTPQGGGGLNRAGRPARPRDRAGAAAAPSGGVQAGGGGREDGDGMAGDGKI